MSSESEPVTPPDLTLEQKLNLETAKIDWQELQRFFAQGLVVVVELDLDLVQVAEMFANDESGQVGVMLEEARVRRADTNDAKRWHDVNSVFWAVVVAPWVLVQEIV